MSDLALEAEWRRPRSKSASGQSRSALGAKFERSLRPERALVYGCAGGAVSSNIVWRDPRTMPPGAGSAFAST